jgi:hypothetical protein
MTAFRKSVRLLERHYKALLPECKLVNMLSHPILFPYPMSFTSFNDNSKTLFNYTEQLEEDGGQSKRHIFLGLLLMDVLML